MNNDFARGASLHTCPLGLGFFILLSSVWLSSCASPDVIAAFARNAQSPLQEGSSIFADIHDSCVRRHSYAQPFTPLYLPATSNTAASGAAHVASVCAPFASQGDALTKASDVLLAYFKVMQQLASFSTSAITTSSQAAAEDAANAAQLSIAQIDSVGKLAGLVTETFTERPQRNRLLKYLREADPDVSAVARGFEDIVSKDYEDLLREEQQTVTARYQAIGDIKDGATILLLNRAYAEDLNALARRKAVADAYVEALEQIRQAHHQLAQNADHLKGRQLSMALEPYTTKLQTLVLVLQKGF